MYSIMPLIKIIYAFHIPVCHMTMTILFLILTLHIITTYLLYSLYSVYCILVYYDISYIRVREVSAEQLTYASILYLAYMSS